MTINPDVFSEFVVPKYDFDKTFDVIVTSCEEGTLDKSELCDIALSRLEHGLSRSTALLIDNRKENVVSWRARGGIAYQFVDDSTFALDLRSVLQV